MHFLTRVEKLLDIPPAEKVLVMRELRSHYFEVKEELMASGMDESAAGQEAERRLGKPEDVAARMGPVYNVAGWKSALMGLVPYFVAIIASMRVLFKGTWGVDLINYLVMILLSLIVVGTIREFVLGRRPIWLTTWFAASMIAPTAVIMMFGGVAAYRWTIIAYTAIPSIISICLVWKSMQKWRTAVAVCVMISILYTVVRLNMHWVSNNASLFILFMLIGLFSVILKALIALVVFMENSYSNAIQASLLLFALFTIHINKFDTFAQSPFYLYVTTLSILTCAGAWLLCVRSPLKPMKYFALAAGLIMRYVWDAILSMTYIKYSGGDVEHGSYFISMILSNLIGFLVYSLIMFTPIIIERRRNKQNLQAVQ